MTIGRRHLVARAIAHRKHGQAAEPSEVKIAAPPTLIEADHADRLVSLVGRWRWVINGELQLLEHMFDERRDGTRHDAGPEEKIRQAMDRARAELDQSFDTHAFQRMAGEIGRRVAEHHKSELNDQVRASLGVDVALRDHKVPQLIDAFVQNNVSRIKTLQRGTVDKLESMVQQAWSSGQRASSLQQQISDRFGVSERHARLISRDQIGKLNGQVTALRHQELGIQSFIWMSVRDTRVRPLHVTLDSQRFRYDNLPSEGLPGTPIACRCGQQPVFDDLVAQVNAGMGESEAAQEPAGFQIGVSSAIGGEAEIAGSELAPPIEEATPALHQGPLEVHTIDPAPMIDLAPNRLGEPFRTPGEAPRLILTDKPAPLGFESVSFEGKPYYRHAVRGRSYTREQLIEREHKAYAIELGGPNEHIAGFDTLELKTPKMTSAEIRFRSQATGATYTREMITNGEAAAQEAFVLHPPEEKKPGLLGRILKRLTGSTPMRGH